MAVPLEVIREHCLAFVEFNKLGFWHLITPGPFQVMGSESNK